MLEFLKNPQLIREKIQREKGIPAGKLEEMIRQRQEEFFGLINEAAAAYSIAKELGVEIDASSQRDYVRIAQLDPSMQDVNLMATVTRVFAPREFERDGRKGKVCNLLIGDGSGNATLVLWNSNVGLVEKGVIEKGDGIEVVGAYVKGSSDGVEVHLGVGGQILKSSGAQHKITKIGELKDGDRDVDIAARVIDVGATNVFERDGRSKRVSSLMVGDESGKAGLVLWDSNAELVKSIEPGDTLKIENAYSKKAAFGIELHADWRSRVIINPKSIRPPQVDFARTRKLKIMEVKDGVECEIEGKISRVLDARRYYTCEKCGGAFVEGTCSRCKGDKAKAKYVVSAFIEDGSGGINATFFDKNALKLLGVKVVPPDVEARTVFELKRDAIIGKEVVLSGRALMNNNLKKLEFIVRGVV